MKKALLVIDMQSVCVGKNHNSFFKYDLEQLFTAVNDTIKENGDNTIIYIRNIMKKNFVNRFAPFKAYEGSQEVELADELNIVGDIVFDKYAGDAFSNPKLNQYLKQQNIDTLELVGIDGGGCVALTAMGAIKNGYSVIINEKAIGTMFTKNKIKYFDNLKAKGAVII